MSEATTLLGTPANLLPSNLISFPALVNIAVVPGTALTPDTGGGGNPVPSVDKALASAAQTARCCGLAVFGAAIDTQTTCQFSGVMGLSEAQWDVVLTDDTGHGLTPGAFYYASAATAGGLTRTAPTGGNFVTPVGLAINTTALLILLQLPTATSS